MLILIKAVDQLIEKRSLSRTRCNEVAGHLLKDQCVESCMLDGHYVMVATAINTLGMSNRTIVSEPFMIGKDYGNGFMEAI
ncbi:MAG: hypothetical protein HY881_22845 [Deltaproteobacteria bacterium]|nr:hypothetical protein [Deltaproteobacteria bacterium]